jgi:hypothetical protein
MSSQAFIFNPTERTLAATGDGFSCPRLTTAGRTGLSLTANDKGMMVYDTTLTTLCIWTGAAWEFITDNSNGILSVKDFGAKGDGVTDDTAAIQAAVNAAMTGAGILYFPANDNSQFYKITAPINITTPITIVGAGPRYTIVLGVGMAAGQYVFNISNAVSTNYFFSVRDIQLRSDNGQPSAVLLKDSSYCLFKNVLLFNTLYGIDITNTALLGCFSNFFEQVHGYNNGASTIRFLSYTGGGHFKFDSCTFNANNIGFLVDSNSGLNNLELISCNFEQCGNNSLYVAGEIQGFSINGCRTEGNNGGQDFFINPAAGKSVVGMSITGTFFTTDVGASNPIRIGGSGGIVRGFNICGNHVSYAADGGPFVFLNGEGESGLIAGNYFTRPTTTPTNVRRAGVVVFGNENSAGKCDESWGSASWAVVQGPWTPVDASGAGLMLGAEGVYQQIGNMVFYQGAVVYPVTADVSNAVIGGLPKNIYSGSFPVGRAGSAISETNSIAIGIENVVGSNAFNFRKAGSVSATNADLSGKYIYFFGQYRIA